MAATNEDADVTGTGPEDQGEPTEPSAPVPLPAPVSSRTRATITLSVLVLSVIGSMIHQAGPVFKWQGWKLVEVKWRLWEWYIEDAAISFAFARNWAAGDGLVAFPGAEPMEGYSNPTWVALMAIWYLFGVDGFWSSKIMAMFFGGATVVLTWLLAKEVIDDEDSWSPLLAPMLLAATPTFAFWNAAGLENPIFNFFLAGGLWRTVVEAKRGGYPFSAVWFLGLAVSRPEAIMYAAWAGFMGMVAALVAGRGFKSTLQWLATFFVPFGVYHVIRYEYFSYVFPNTYYAKLGSKDFRPFAWSARGWKYIRNFGFDSGTGWFLPVYVTGLVGLRGARKWWVPVATLLFAFGFLYPNGEITTSWKWWPTDLPEPSWWAEARVWLLFGTAMLLPVTALRDRRAFGRVLCWGVGMIVLFFCVRSGGDWMKGFRWMNFLVVPAAVLFTVGVDEIAALAQRVFGRSPVPGWSTPGWLVATMLPLAILPGWFMHSDWFFGKRETGPFSVKKRSDYSDSVMDRLFVQDRLIHNLDVDMGAHLYWSTHKMVDMAGLVDVSIAHHSFKQRSFTQEYVFKEKRPEFAHVHGSWATTSRVPTFPEWKRDYVGIPGFPVSTRGYHVGNFVRRDLLLTPDWQGEPGRKIPFAAGITFEGFNVPSPEISQGKALYVEVGVSTRNLDDREDFRVLAFLAPSSGGEADAGDAGEATPDTVEIVEEDGVDEEEATDEAEPGRKGRRDEPQVFTFDVPVGYDWVPPSEWRPGEVNTIKVAPGTPKGLEPGLYDLGFLLLGADGRVIEPDRTADGERFVRLPEGVVVGGYDSVPAAVAVGEVRFPAVVRIGAPGSGEKAAKDDLERALQLARSGDCEGATKAWTDARLHLPRAKTWNADQRARFAPAAATCFANKADKQTDLLAAVPLLEEARVWDHRNERLLEVGERVGAALFERGEVAMAEEDWTAAYADFDGSIKSDPSNAWARNLAEKARDKRLGIDEESEEAARLEREEAARERAESAKAREEAAGAEQDEEAPAPEPLEPEG